MKIINFNLPRLDIMKSSILVSFLLHLIIILLIQSIFPFNFINQELRTYEVELIRSPVLDINTDIIPQEIISQMIEEKQSDVSPEVETIALNTKDTRYISYTKMLKQRIGAQWKYPAEAMESLIEGQLSLLFTLNRNGGLISIRVLYPSGHYVLDEEASRAVQMAAPYPPFPSRITANKLNIIASFDYRLTSRKIKHHQGK
jgi:TonB family protein